MSYTEDIVRPLLDTFSKTAGLPTFQLAGHVPRRSGTRLDVIADYPQRYAKMLKAQAAFDVSDPDAAKSRKRHGYEYPPARLALSPALATRLSHELTAERLIIRCLKEELIDIVTADDLRAIMNRDGQAATT
jgi:hypothetical protein